MKLSKTMTSVTIALLLSATAVFAQEGEVHQGYSDIASQYDVDGKFISNVDLKVYL